MKRFFKVTLITALLVVISAGMVFAGGGQQQQAQDGQWRWTRRVTFVSPWGPGGGSGPTIRNIAPLVERVIGISTEVNHVEGAGGANGAIFASRQPADGYTWLLATQSQILLDLQGMLSFNFREEFIPIGKLVHSTNSILASAVAIRGRYHDYHSMVNYIRANPRVVTVGMLSAGGTDQASLFQLMSLALNVPMARLEEFITIVPYGGGAEVDAALIGGHIHLGIGGPGEVEGLIESGDIIPIIVMSEKRLDSFPDILSTGELGIPAYIGTWRGIFARRGTPQAAMDEMERVLRQAWNMPEYQAFCEAEGFLERTGFEGQADFRRLVDNEYAAMTEYLRAAGVIR